MERFRDNIFVIGAGSMAEAFIRGVTERGVVAGEQIRVINRTRGERLEHLQSTYGVIPAESFEEISLCRFVLMSAKPFDSASALQAARPYLSGQPVISFAAGVTLDWLSEEVHLKSPVIRTMPNIPVAVLAGTTAVSFGEDVLQPDRDAVLFLLKQVGDVVEVPETMMDAVTAVSGSGPGFVCYFLEAMEDAAVRLGFTPELARRLILHTVAGTAKTLSEWGLSPSEMRTRVTSPNGTTQAGITAMAEGELPKAVSDALFAAAARSADLGQNFVKSGRT